MKTGDLETSCPRCGYDLSGVVASWSSSCPLDGVCSECGLGFAWGSLWDGSGRAPRWYIESRPGPRQLVSTSARLLWPSRLLDRLDLRMELRPLRLAIFAVLWFILSHLMLAATVLSLTVYHYERYVAFWSARIARPMPTLQSWIDPWDMLWPYKAVYGLDGMQLAVQVVLFPILVGLLVPSLCFLFSDTLRFERVRLLHLIRLGILWLAASVFGGSLLLSVDTVRRQFPDGAVVAVLEWVVPILGFVVYLLWPALFWHRAFKTYLRMSRPRVAAGVIVAAALVIGLTLIIVPNVFVS